ncbi:MAG: oligogalacturonate lyase family protein [Bacteroidota bacterium]
MKLSTSVYRQLTRGYCYLMALVLASHVAVKAQPVLETGSQKPMPNEWIDKDTRHKVVKLSRIEGSSMSFYFHNDPFVDGKMVFYNSSKQKGGEESERIRRPATAENIYDKQMYLLDMKTFQAERLTNSPVPMSGEVVSPKLKEAFFQIKDSVFAVHVKTKKQRLVFVFPADYKGSIATVNADGTLLAGSKASDEQKEIVKKHPLKSEFFQLIFDAHLPNDLFTVNVKTGELKKIHTENTWLGHVQFSPTDPALLMFCHEGPWHKLDRIWTINVNTKEVKLMHKRTMDMEIAGHEWLGTDGKTIWYDLQMPKGQTFFIGGTDIATGTEQKWEMQRDEWSIHFNTFQNGKIFCGDGADPGQVAKAKNGQWIYLFTPDGKNLKSEKLVNMKTHDYKLEPNVHFTPDGKWVIFRANFEGIEQVYAAEVAVSN